MSAARPLGPVTADELLARFITDKDWFRADLTIRQDAFIPPKDLQLSVTRHLNLSEQTTLVDRASRCGRACRLKKLRRYMVVLIFLSSMFCTST